MAPSVIEAAAKRFLGQQYLSMKPFVRAGQFSEVIMKLSQIGDW